MRRSPRLGGLEEPQVERAIVYSIPTGPGRRSHLSNLFFYILVAYFVDLLSSLFDFRTCSRERSGYSLGSHYRKA